MKRTRREFLHEAFSVCGAFGVAPALTAMSGRLASGEVTARRTDRLVDAIDETTGLPLVRLPEGFRYQSFGWTGDLMQDGIPTPADHDGMGVVRADGPILTLVRNHENSDHGPALATPAVAPFDPQAQAGCTTLQFDTERGEFLKSWLSLAGTSRNCAGGITPWGTWLSCEETVLGENAVDHYKNNVQRNFEREHGWIFEVDPTGTKSPVPLLEMGRFVHEAVAIDQSTGIVYETEDRPTAGFYRFVPKQPGHLAAGGQLEIAEAVGRPDLRGGVSPGATFDIRWHAVPEPTRAHSPAQGRPDELGVFTQGKAMGGTTFARLEGCWFGNGKVYFDATSGGQAEAGQIWQFDPSREKLTLLFESPAKEVLNMPDNLCVNPKGGLMLCEDNDYGAEELPQRMFSLSQDGRLTLFAQNNLRLNGERNGFTGDFRNKEWAGATFSPDGRWLFVNLQTPGITLAITGPWESLSA